MSSFQTAITYDEEMTKHHCIWDPNYPECPERFSHVLKRCKELGLVSRCRRIPSREATNDEILAKHSLETITLLEESQNKTVEEMEEISSRYDSIYICNETFKLAKLAAGSTIDLVKEVCSGDARNGMAIVRPPGHHAMKSTYCGYCFYNNVALAADYALKNCNVSRILIVDWDVHHGQATQQMFYDDKRVLYFSIHRYEYGTFWPNLRESDYDHVGSGSGLGYNFNVPLNKVGFGNSEYLSIFHQLLLPVAAEFEPNLVLVSGGYDAALGDEKGLMKVEPACYAHLVRSLMQFADGKVAVVLEGGYFLKSLAEGAALTLRSLLGDPCPNIEPLNEPDDNLVETIRNVIHSHQPYWKCFQIKDTFSSLSKLSSFSSSTSHKPCIKFDYDEEPLQVFPTRGCYATVLEDMKSYYNEWLDDLIECTNLNVPKHNCALITERSKNGIWLDYAVQEGKFIQNDGNWQTETFFDTINKPGKVDWEIDAQMDGLEQAIHLVTAELARCVIFEATGTDVDSYLEVLNKNYTKKILVIDFHYGEGQRYEITENILNLQLTNGQTSENKNRIQLGWRTDLQNWEFLVSWFKTVLPISYQFGPELTLIFVDFEKWGVHFTESKASAELLSRLVLSLNTMGRGKLLIIHNRIRLIENETAKLAYLTLCRKLSKSS